MANCHDVAAYIVQKHSPLSAMKLQKLVYYCQAWSLVWDDRPMFSEPLRAWVNGPVVEELYNEHRGQFLVESWAKGDTSQLDKDAVDTIDLVLEAYGNLNAQQLSDLTHSEPPWQEAREGLGPLDRSEKIISLETMGNYYSNLPGE